MEHWNIAEVSENFIIDFQLIHNAHKNIIVVASIRSLNYEVIEVVRISSIYFKPLKFSKTNINCIGNQIYVDADSKLSSLELGTMEHPFRFIDDAFRELFNRFQIYDEKDTDFNVTIYLRGRIPSNI